MHGPCIPADIRRICLPLAALSALDLPRQDRLRCSYFRLYDRLKPPDTDSRQFPECRISVPVAASLLRGVSSTYIRQPMGMDARSMPTQEMVIRDGQPIWRVCGQGLCIEDASGIRAMTILRALCSSRGIELPSGGHQLPMRGPAEVDEPGV